MSKIQFKDNSGNSLDAATSTQSVIHKNDTLFNFLESLNFNDSKNLVDVAEDGFYIIDSNGYITLKINNEIDIVNISNSVNINSNNTDINNIQVTELSKWNFGKTLQSTDSEVVLPHSCNSIDGVGNSYYRGKTYYTHNIQIDNSSNYILLIKQASQKSTLYINDIEVITHKSGYTPFSVDITDYLHNGDNKIVIMCDNSMDLTLPPVSSDFNKNNGLCDKVFLLKTCSLFLDLKEYGYNKIHVKQYDVSDSSAKYTVYTKINNKSGIDRYCSILLEVKDNAGCIVHKNLEQIIVPKDGLLYSYSNTLISPTLWNGIKNPYLYTFNIKLLANSVVCENTETSVGFRYYEIDKETGFKLNGQSYLLRGISYHQDYPNKASAMSIEDIDNDFNIVSELGCNFLRLAHYPHNSYTFDKCDKLGIIVQTEIPWVNECGVNSTDEYFTIIKQQMKEMVVENYNHPSIVFWGMWNELGGTHANYPQGAIDTNKVVNWTNELYTYTKSLDNNRFVGMADNQLYSKDGWKTMSGDYFAENVYEGWYSSYGSSGCWKMKSQMDSIKSSVGPIALTEYGAGCNPNCHSLEYDTTTNFGSNGARHNEEFANIFHENYLKQICQMPYLIFSSAWVLFDFAVAARKEGYIETSDGVNLTTNTKKYYINDKGVVTRDRNTKKDVFYLYKSKWSSTPVIYITSKRFTSINSDTIKIKAYSNASKLELYQNNILKQTMTTPESRTGVIWEFNELIFENTTDSFKICGYNSDGNNIGEDSCDFSHF